MATLEQIQTRLKKLQAQAEMILAKKAQAAVDQIRALMLEHGLTTEDIEAKAKARRQAKASNGSADHVNAKASDGVKGKAVPKYQHPKTGATWSGHGRAPAWIAEAKDRNKFLIAGSVEAVVAANAGAVSKAKAVGKKASKTVGVGAGKGQPKGPQAAKYRDPKSGATWSGRGPAPAWLASLKDRSKFLIGGSATVVSEAGIVSKASKPKAAAKKAVAAKSPAAKKAVSVVKKVTAKKAASKKAASVKTVAAKVEAPAVPNASTEVSA